MGKLGFLNDWRGKAGGYVAKRNAQSYLTEARVVRDTAGSACGTGDGGKKATKPTESGTGDDGEKKPAPKPAGGGAEKDGKKKIEPKPSACGVGGR